MVAHSYLLCYLGIIHQSPNSKNLFWDTAAQLIGATYSGMHTHSILGLQVGVEGGHQEGGHVCFPINHSIMEGSSTNLKC